MSNTDLTNVISPTGRQQAAEQEAAIPKPFQLLFPVIDTHAKYQAKLHTDPMFLFAPIAICDTCFTRLTEGQDQMFDENNVDDSDAMQVPIVSEELRAFLLEVQHNEQGLEEREEGIVNIVSAQHSHRDEPKFLAVNDDPLN